MGIAVTDIQSEAFSGCTRLTQIKLLDTVAEIALDAFVNCPRLSISGYRLSYAYTYARSCNIAFQALSEKPGDINGDGNVSLTDVLEIQKYLSAVSQLTPFQLRISDYDGNDRVNTSDVLAIQRAIARL